MIEAGFFRERGLRLAAALGLGASAVVGYQDPAAALVNTQISIDCDNPYTVVVDNNQSPLDVNGDPQIDRFTFTTEDGNTVSVDVQGGQEGSVSLGTDADLEDTTATVEQTSVIYGDIYGADADGSVVLNCEDDTPPSSPTTNAPSTPSSASTTEGQNPPTTPQPQEEPQEQPPAASPADPVAPPASPAPGPAGAATPRDGFEFGHTA